MRSHGFSRAFITIGVIALIALAIFLIALLTIPSRYFGINTLFPARPIASRDKVSIVLDSTRLEVPSNYLRTRDALKLLEEERPVVLLWTVFPTFEGYSNAKASDFLEPHKQESRYIWLHIAPIRRPEHELVQLSAVARLRELTDKKARAQQLVKSDTDPELPTYEVYRPVDPASGPRTIYAAKVLDDLILAHCNEGVPAPSCSVSFRWRNNVFVEYRFKRKLMAQLPGIHTGVHRLIESFVADGKSSGG